MAVNQEILGFVAEWYDPMPQTVKQFTVKIFMDYNDIEIYYRKENKAFLKKCAMPSNLSSADFFLGGKVLIHSRLMTLVDYADPYTRRKLGPMGEKSTVVLSPDAFYNAGKIIQGLVGETGLKLSNLRTVGLKEAELQDLFPLLGVDGAPHAQLVQFWTSGLILAVEVAGVGAAQAVETLLPQLRARFAANAIEQGVWSGGPGVGDFFFGGVRRFAPTATLDNCSCVLIRPHAVKSGDAPAILDEILSSRQLSCTAVQMFSLDKVSAKEFLEVYEGVMPSVGDMVVALCAGPLIALEVKLSDPAAGPVVPLVRDLVGPWDVEMAKELKPDTLRARFGVSRTDNAVHVTDLEEDGPTECAYFFDLLAGK